MKLVIALIVLINGEPDETKTTYYINPNHCEYVAQMLTRQRRYYMGVEEGTVFCRPAWVEEDTKVTRLNVIPKPEVEEDAE
tara:strand:+ start:1383 stop:1625 length:243 start_codon:yes stop_codon:yes gene_type:complete